MRFVLEVVLADIGVELFDVGLALLKQEQVELFDVALGCNHL